MRHSHTSTRVPLMTLGLLWFAAPSLLAANPTNLPPPVVMTAAQDHQNMMDQLRITSIRPGRNGSDPQSPNYANYDEYITARPSRDNVASTTGK